MEILNHGNLIDDYNPFEQLFLRCIYFEMPHFEYKIQGIPEISNITSKAKEFYKYLIAFDDKHQRIVMLENEKLKVKTLQVGKRENSLLGLNVDTKCYNDFFDVNTMIKHEDDTHANDIIDMDNNDQFIQQTIQISAR
ncbi:hypothetical protein RFI_32682 [Reticulomyxa filosa]|uniref:Uncharacterized protein n=1 Tax=Reticulomyxa filosa TaxID=46433 RepID=X6LST6_RETFI|nr:hypothetical protein RFI_32682 [Reticulomyxa filosa]|eukprot:ETO04714.1 hypothetical protein RFI_32682 [Reticulomyxa filosa]